MAKKLLATRILQPGSTRKSVKTLETEDMRFFAERKRNIIVMTNGNF